MNFQIAQIANGWVVKGTWIEPGSQSSQVSIPSMARSEDLYCRDAQTAGEIFKTWAAKGFEEALELLQQINQKGEETE